MKQVKSKSYITSQQLIEAYHGTSKENLAAIRSSGYLRKSRVPNLTSSKDYAAASAKKFFAEEDAVVLFFRFPSGYAQENSGSYIYTLVENLPTKYLVGVEKIKKLNVQQQPEEMVQRKSLAVPNSVDYNREKAEVLKNLGRNPKAYIPLYMRNDTDLARYTK